MSKRFYLFNHYLMLASIAVFVLWSVFCIVLMPFMKNLSLDFLRWLSKGCGWVYPITLAVFAVSSSVAKDGFMKFRVKREWEEEKKNKPEEQG